MVRRGRVRSMEVRAGAEAIVAVQDRGQGDAETLVVQRVLHATGVGPDAVQDGVIAGFVAAGLARTDVHGMGLDVTARLQLLDANGQRTPGVWALGPLVRGVFWECTAVPDIRQQARTIATEVAEALRRRVRG